MQQRGQQQFDDSRKATGISATPALDIAGGTRLAVGTGGSFGQQGDQTQYSLDKVPDVIGQGRL